MNESPRTVRARHRNIRYREATPRDGLALWRLRRLKMTDETVSPFFYLSLLQRRVHSCVVADQGGEVVGYALARRGEAGTSVRVLDLAVAPEHDTGLLAAGLLSCLVKLPEHEGATIVEAQRDAHVAVSRMLGDLSTGAGTRRSRNAPCTTADAVDDSIR